MTTRQQKVGELLKVEISDIVRREMKDPRLGFLTITDVSVTADMRQAQAFISVMGDESERKASLDALNRASGFIRGELGRRLRMKIIPEVEFHMDASIEEGARIFELLQQIKKDESKKD